MRTWLGLWVSVYLFMMSIYWLFGDSTPIWWTFYQVNKEVFIALLLATVISDELILFRKVAYYIALTVTLILTILFTIDYNYEYRWVNDWAVGTSVTMLFISLVMVVTLKRKP